MPVKAKCFNGAEPRPAPSMKPREPSKVRKKPSTSELVLSSLIQPSAGEFAKPGPNAVRSIIEDWAPEFRFSVFGLTMSVPEIGLPELSIAVRATASAEELRLARDIPSITSEAVPCTVLIEAPVKRGNATEAVPVSAVVNVNSLETPSFPSESAAFSMKV